MNDFIRSVKEASLEISSLLGKGMDGAMLEKFGKGHGGDISRGVDIAAENILIERLSAYGEIDSEEAGIVGEGSDRIIIDPLDGSSNALSAFPYYGISVARSKKNGEVADAAVCNLANGDLFYLYDGGAVKYENLFSRVRTTGQAPGESSIGLFEKSYANPDMVKVLNENGLKFRSPGAVALSLAYASRVRYFLFAGDFRIYDFAAGLALCKGMSTIVRKEYVIVSSDSDLASRIEALIEPHLRVAG